MNKSKKKSMLIFIGIAILVICASLAFVIGKQKVKPSNKPNIENTENKEEKDPEPIVVSQEKETLKGDISDFKYGVKKQAVTYNTYDVYSDGTRKLVFSEDSFIYHHGGYCATMEELKAEGESAVKVYMDSYYVVLNHVNELRVQKGIAALQLDEKLCNVASFRAAELEYSGKFSHERPDGSGCFNVTEFYGITYKYFAENIAQGFETTKSAVNAWKKDATDYGYMLDARFTKLGVGFSDAGINKEWVTVFSD